MSKTQSKSSPRALYRSLLKSSAKNPSKTSHKSSGKGSSWHTIYQGIKDSFATLISIFCISLLMGGVICQWVSPIHLHYLQYLGIGFGLSLIASLLWCLILLFRHRWRNLSAMVIALLILHGPILRVFPFHLNTNEAKPSASRQCDSLRILTYNTYGLGGAQLNNASNPIPVLDMVEASGADIVCLQEYAFSNRKGAHNEQELRNRMRSTYPYYDFTPSAGRTILGIAFFSRYPIRKAERIDKRPKDYVSAMYYQLELPDGNRIAVVNCHLHTNSIKVSDRQLTDDMHFEADDFDRLHRGPIRALGRSYRRRALEAQLIETYLHDNHPKGMPLIICGDLNDTPISYCYHKMRGSLDDAWVNAGFGPGTTYNRHHYWFRIDHIFHSQHFRTLDTHVLRQYEYSDHYPVTTVLQRMVE